MTRMKRNRLLTRAGARAWRARWRHIAEAERRELRRTPPARKLRQLAALMASVHALGWTQALAAGEEEVRKRWCRLRRILHA